MDINFLVEKLKEFEDSENYSECMEYVRAREKNIFRTEEKIKKFIYSKISLKKLKTGIAKLSEEELKIKKKRVTSIWGADGPKGMLFFNLIINYSSKDKLNDLDKLLKNCFSVPNNINEAATKIDLFSIHLETISDSITPEKIKESKYPDKSWKYIKMFINPTYSTAFIPVFWDMQELDKFPIYYTSCEKVIKKLDEKDNYYSRFNSPGENYRLFYEFNLDLKKLLKKEYKKNLSFSDISTNYLNYIFETYLKNKKI